MASFDIDPSGSQSPINPDTDFNTSSPGISPGGIDSDNIQESDVQAFQGAMEAAPTPLQENPNQVNVMNLGEATSPHSNPPGDIEESFKSMDDNFELLKGQANFFNDNDNLSAPPATESTIKGTIHDFASNFQSLSQSVEGPQLQEPPPLGSPLKQFLSYFTGAQDKMNDLNHTLANQSGKMNSGELLSLQHKMNKMQQQVELATTMTNKVVEFFKQMQNIQL